MNIIISDDAIATEIKRALVETSYDSYRASALQRAAKRVMECSVIALLEAHLARESEAIFADPTWQARLRTALEEGYIGALKEKAVGLVKGMKRQEIGPLLAEITGGLKL